MFEPVKGPELAWNQRNAPWPLCGRSCVTSHNGQCYAAKSLQLCPTVWPHRRHTRLPRPWDSPGKNTGVGCHFLLQSMKVKSESGVAQSCPTLATPWTGAYQAPLSTGFSRQEFWSGVPLPSPTLWESLIKLTWSKHMIHIPTQRPGCNENHQFKKTLVPSHLIIARTAGNKHPRA